MSRFMRRMRSETGEKRRMKETGLNMGGEGTKRTEEVDLEMRMKVKRIEEKDGGEKWSESQRKKGVVGKLTNA
jgi:hypothetical protein